MLRHMDELRSHRFYVAGGLGLVKCYLELHRRREAGEVTGAEEPEAAASAGGAAANAVAPDPTANMSSRERRAYVSGWVGLGDEASCVGVVINCAMWVWFRCAVSELRNPGVLSWACLTLWSRLILYTRLHTYRYERKQSQAAAKAAAKAAKEAAAAADDDDEEGGGGGGGGGGAKAPKNSSNDEAAAAAKMGGSSGKKAGSMPPDGHALARVADPLAEAAKWVQKLVDTHSDATGTTMKHTITPRARLDVWLAQVEVGGCWCHRSCSPHTTDVQMV